MLEKELLHRLFSQADGASFAVKYWDQTYETYGDGPLLFTLHLRDLAVVRAFLADYQMAFGEAWVAGKIDVEGSLDAFLILTMVTLDKQLSSAPIQAIVSQVAHQFTKRSRRRQKADVARHYDLGNSFFRLWLDDTMSYSCAYFRSDTDTIEQAQRQKIDHTLRKLRLQPEERLLDIGCGWGALIMRAAEAYQVKALGITLSEEQLAGACDQIEERGLRAHADVRLIDYKSLAREGRVYDKIVSVGMIEHVGKRHLPEYMASVKTSLRPGGLALLHTITSPLEGPMNSWMERYIFPGAYIPTVEEIVHHLRANNLRILDVENLRMHYKLTLDRWSERFEAHIGEIREMYGEEFVRMWRLYLRGSSASFLCGGLEIHQFLVSNGKSDLAPMTRDDLSG